MPITPLIPWPYIVLLTLPLLTATNGSFSRASLIPEEQLAGRRILFSQLQHIYIITFVWEWDLMKNQDFPKLNRNSFLWTWLFVLPYFHCQIRSRCYLESYRLRKKNQHLLNERAKQIQLSWKAAGTARKPFHQQTLTCYLRWLAGDVLRWVAQLREPEEKGSAILLLGSEWPHLKLLQSHWLPAGWLAALQLFHPHQALQEWWRLQSAYH